MLENIDFTSISIAVAVVIGGYFVTKLALNRQDSNKKVWKDKEKEMNEYIIFLKKQMQVYKNKASNMERGPELEGDLGELGSLIPNFIGEFSEYAPKWLKPFLKNQDIQAALITKVKENPEKFSDVFGKLIGKKGEKKESEESTSAEITV